jgi:hypothetical protein
MADISDDEVLEKPKRVMSDKQKEALKKGRELSKANREKARESLAKPTLVRSEPAEEVPKKRVKKVKEVKEVKEEVKPEPEPIVEEVKTTGKRVSRKPKVVEPEPAREPSPPPTPKKTRTPRQKKQQVPAEMPPAPQRVIPKKASLVFV